MSVHPFPLQVAPLIGELLTRKAAGQDAKQIAEWLLSEGVHSPYARWPGAGVASAETERDRIASLVRFHFFTRDRIAEVEAEARRSFEGYPSQEIAETAKTTRARRALRNGFPNAVHWSELAGVPLSELRRIPNCGTLTAIEIATLRDCALEHSGLPGSIWSEPMLEALEHAYV